MSGRTRYLRMMAVRTRAPLVPIVASLFLLLGNFSSVHHEVGKTWALTALATGALSAWLVSAVLAAEPEAQANMATAAGGGRGSRVRMDLVLIGIVGSGLTAAFVAYPLLLAAFAEPDLFDRPVRVGDVTAAGLSHLCCAVVGGASGVLLSPPWVTRRAMSATGILAAMIALAAVSDHLGAAGGPVAVARALTDARPGSLNVTEFVAWMSCLALTGAILIVASAWTRCRG